MHSQSDEHHIEQMHTEGPAPQPCPVVHSRPFGEKAAREREAEAAWARYIDARMEAAADEPYLGSD